MASPPCCPDDQQLRALLDETKVISATGLLAHIGECRHCQQSLDQLVMQHSSLQLSSLISDRRLSWLDLRAALRIGPPSAGKEASLGRLGDYEIIEVIGCGGMGIVFKASDSRLHRTVAIKMPVPQVAEDPTIRQRFRREARAAASIDHENVVTVFTWDEHAGVPFMVMEYVDGSSLQQRLDLASPFLTEEVKRIALEAASGLAAAHGKGIIHRDIKPANILLEHGSGRAKLTDFGLARLVDQGRLTREGLVAGTPGYMAPEQACGKDIDQRADLFSLGAVLYAMCTGRPPGSSVCGAPPRTPAEHAMAIRNGNPALPPWLVSIVAKLLAHQPDDRFRSVDELLRALRQGGARSSGQHSLSRDPAGHTTGENPGPTRTLQKGARRTSPLAKRIHLALAFGMLFSSGLCLVDRRKPDDWSRPFTAERKTMAPELTPSRASSRFVVVRAASHRTATFDQFGEALASADSGDTIELHWNGPLDCETVRLGGKALTIRAGPRYRPVLRAQKNNASLLETQAPLELEGIEFQATLDDSPPATTGVLSRGVVMARGMPIRVANCRFVLSGFPPMNARMNCIHVERAPSCELENCELRSPRAAGITTDHATRLVVRNCVFVSLLAVSSINPGRQSHIHLQHNTVLSKKAIHIQRSPQSHIQVASVGNVFALVREPLALIGQGHVLWRESHNLYINEQTHLSSSVGDSVFPVNNAPALRHCLAPAPPGIQLALRRTVLQHAPHQIRLTDLRVDSALGSGADIDLVGPGRAYDRWRKQTSHPAVTQNTKPAPQDNVRTCDLAAS